MRNNLFAMLWCLLAAVTLAHADGAAWEAQMAAARNAATFGYYTNDQVNGDWDAAVRHYKAAVKEAEKFTPPDPRLAASLYALGLCYTHLPDNEQMGMESYMETHDAESYLRRADQLYQRAAAICTQAYGKDDPRMALTECKLAELASDHPNDTTSVMHYRKALELVKRANPRDVAITAEVYDLLLEYYNSDQQSTDNLQRLALASVEQAYGKDDPRIADRLCQLAAVLTNVDAAEELFKRALSNVEHAYSATDPRAEDVHCRQAIYFAAHHRLPDAKAILARVLANAEQAYGPQDIRLLPTLYRLESTLAAIGMLKYPSQPETIASMDAYLLRAAMQAYLQHTAIASKAGDEQTTEESYLLRATTIATNVGGAAVQMDAWGRLGAYYQAQNLNEQAWLPLEHALSAAEQAYGADDLRILPSLFALAEWSITEDPAQIDPLYQRATAIVDKAVDHDLLTVEHLQRIATAYEQTERQPAAQAIWQQIGEIESHNPQADPDDVIATLKRLVAKEPQQADAATPTPAQARLLEYIAKCSGQRSSEMVGQIQQLLDHVLFATDKQQLRKAYYLHRLAEILPNAYSNQGDLANALDQLGERQQQSGLANEAIMSYSRALTLYDKQVPPVVYLQYDIVRELGRLCQQTGALDKAEIYLTRAVKLVDKVDNDKTSPDDALKELAKFYHATGKFTKADNLYQQLYHRRVNRLGASNEASVKVLIARARIFDEVGLPAQAAPLLRRALADAEKDPRIPHVGNWAGNLLGAILQQQYVTYRQMRQLSAADACLTRLFAMLKGPDPEKVNQADSAIWRLVILYQSEKQNTLAADLLQRLLDVQEQRNGADSPRLEFYLPRLGDIKMALHDVAGADQCYARLLAIEEKNDIGSGPRPEFTSNVLGVLVAVADYYRSRQRDDLVEALWCRQLARDHTRYGDQLTAYTGSILHLCDALRAEKKYPEAEAQLQPLLTAVQENAKQQSLPMDIELTAGNLYLAWGKPEQSITYLHDAYTQADTIFMEDDQAGFLLPYAEAYAAALQALHRDDEAQTITTRITALRNSQAKATTLRNDIDDI